MTDLPWDFARLPFKNLARYGPGVSLRVVELTYWEANGTADATGTVTLVSDPVPNDTYWLADRVYADSDSNLTGRFDLYEADTPSRANRRAWGPVPFQYPLTRAFSPAIVFRPTRPMLAVVSNLQQGNTITLAVAYVVVKRVVPQ